MKIIDFYKKYEIPQNLKRHMLSVAKVVVFLKEHWLNNEIDWSKMILAALVHDTGNIVKFDLDSTVALQKKYVQKYGKDDHLATENILKEAGVDPGIIRTVHEKSFDNTVKIAAGNNWYVKILAYADLRVIPRGIVSLEERVADIQNRMPKYSSRADFPDLIAACYQIEKQIQDSIDIPLTRLTAECEKLPDESLNSIKII